MKKIVTTALSITILLMTSCTKDEIKPQVIEKEVLVEVEIDEPLIESLRLYYYGDEIKVYEDSKRLVGPSGSVSYHLYQESEHDNTAFVTGEFQLTGSSATDFSNISYKLLINMNNKSCELIEATKDNNYISNMNLILMLGEW